MAKSYVIEISSLFDSSAISCAVFNVCRTTVFDVGERLLPDLLNCVV